MTYKLVKNAETAGDIPSKPIIWNTNPPSMKNAKIEPSYHER